MNLNEFFTMGGYALYVWTAYGLTLCVFGINVWLIFSEKRRINKIIKQVSVSNKKMGIVLTMQSSQSL